MCCDYIKAAAAEYNNGWIPCEKELPPEPEKVTDDRDIDFAIKWGAIRKYLATVKGIEHAIEAYYIGDGQWYEYCTGISYQAIAWMPMLEAYRSEGGKQ